MTSLSRPALHHSKRISVQEAAKKLGISVDQVRKLAQQGILHDQLSDTSEDTVLLEEVDRIQSNTGLMLSQEAAQVATQLQRQIVTSLTWIRNFIIMLCGGVGVYLLLIVVFVLLLNFFPLQTARWLGYVKTASKSLSFQSNNSFKRVLGATTTATPVGAVAILQAALQPIGSTSLGIIKFASPASYTQIAQATILNPNDVLDVNDDGSVTPVRPITFANGLLQVADPALVANLNADFLQGKKPGTNVGDIAVVGENLTSISTSTPTNTESLANKTLVVSNSTVSGLTNSNLSGSAGITNANLANSSLTVSAGAGLTGGGVITLGSLGNFDIGAGNGITVNDNDITLRLTSSEIAGMTSSNSGLEVSGSGVTLLHGCADDELLKWTDANGWACAEDDSGLTIRETDGTPAAVNISALEFGPTSISSDEFIITDQTSGVARIRIGDQVALLNQVETVTGGWVFDTASTTFTTGIIANGGITSNATALNLSSGTGNVTLQAAGTGTTSNVQVGAGGAGSATPDLLVLDIKNSANDPPGTNGAMYYNTNTNKFRCFENGVWTNCITAPTVSSDLQHATAYDTSEALTNITASQTTLGAVSVTPSTTTGDVYVVGQADVYSSNATDQPFTLTIETTSDCTGAPVGNATRTYTITSGASGTANRGALIVSGIAVDPGASAQAYSLCASTSAGDSDVLNWRIEALVIDTGADLAEIYTSNDATLESGDIVSYDPLLMTGVRKSQKAYDPMTLGIVATKPGLVIGGVDNEGVMAIPIALAGRVPVKVSTEGGNIEVGDSLTSSSTPGVAMKATKAGPIIATAMSSYDGAGVGSILAFVKTGYFNGARTFILQNSVVNDDEHSGRTLLGQIMSNNLHSQSAAATSEILTDRVIAGLEIVSPKITTNELFATHIRAEQIDGLKDFVMNIATSSAAPVPISPNSSPQAIASFFSSVSELFTDIIFRGEVRFFGRTTLNNDAGGFAVIAAGATSVVVTFNHEYTAPPVVTSSSDSPVLYSVNNVNTKGFQIGLQHAESHDVKFAWTATAIHDAQTFTGREPSSPASSPSTTPETETSPVLTSSPPPPSSTPTPTVRPSPVSSTEQTALPITPTPTPSPTPSLEAIADHQDHSSNATQSAIQQDVPSPTP